MLASSLIKARIHPSAKNVATVVVTSIGMTVSSAGRLISRDKAHSFKPLVPNAITTAAMYDARAGNLPSFNSVVDLMADLHAEN